MKTDKDRARELARHLRTEIYPCLENKAGLAPLEFVILEEFTRIRSEAAERMCKMCQKNTPCENNCKTVSAILGNSVVKEKLTTENTVEAEKNYNNTRAQLAIAVKALKNISSGKVITEYGVDYLTFSDVVRISDKALKEIQG